MSTVRRPDIPDRPCPWPAMPQPQRGPRRRFRRPIQKRPHAMRDPAPRIVTRHTRRPQPAADRIHWAEPGLPKAQRRLKRAQVVPQNRVPHLHASTVLARCADLSVTRTSPNCALATIRMSRSAASARRAFVRHPMIPRTRSGGDRSAWTSFLPMHPASRVAAKLPGVVTGVVPSSCVTIPSSPRPPRPTRPRQSPTELAPNAPDSLRKKLPLRLIPPCQT